MNRFQRRGTKEVLVLSLFLFCSSGCASFYSSSFSSLTTESQVLRTHYYKASLAKVVDAATEAISDVNNCVVEDVDSIDDSHVLIIAVYLNEKKVKYVIWIGIAEFSKDNINVDVFSRSDSGISSEHGRIAKDFFERLDNLLGVPARSSLQKTSSP